MKNAICYIVALVILIMSIISFIFSGNGRKVETPSTTDPPYLEASENPVIETGMPNPFI